MTVASSRVQWANSQEAPIKALNQLYDRANLEKKLFIAIILPPHSFSKILIIYLKSFLIYLSLEAAKVNKTQWENEDTKSSLEEIPLRIELHVLESHACVSGSMFETREKKGITVRGYKFNRLVFVASAFGSVFNIVNCTFF